MTRRWKAALYPALAAVTVLLVLPAGSSLAGPSRAAKDLVYKLSVSVADGRERATEWVTWSGFWRSERPDGGIRMYTKTSRSAIHHSYATFYPNTGFSVRTGSAAFLGSAVDGSLALAAVKSYAGGNATRDEVEVTTTPEGKTQLRFTVRGLRVVATIEERTGLIDPTESATFRIPEQQVTSVTTERFPGERPAGDVRPYWFGMKFGQRRVVTTIEHARRRPIRELVYVALYELPSAGGRSSALPGQGAPVGELQVSSQPVKSTLAQRAINAFKGSNGGLRYKPWPRTTVKLRSGERVTVVPSRSEGIGPVRAGFSVITKSTLVGVSGSVQLKNIPALARKLRRIN